MNGIPPTIDPKLAFRGVPQNRGSCNGSLGFSLVELVVALGIVSFAFVSMLGLLPIGVSTFRQSMETVASAQIMQRIVGEAQQTDFSTLTATSGTTRYFDEQCNEVSSLGESIYTVEVTVTSPAAVSNTTSSTSGNLAKVCVKIANNPGHNPTPFSSTNASVIRTVLIAKN